MYAHRLGSHSSIEGSNVQAEKETNDHDNTKLVLAMCPPCLTQLQQMLVFRPCMSFLSMTELEFKISPHRIGIRSLMDKRQSKHNKTLNTKGHSGGLSHVWKCLKKSFVTGGLFPRSRRKFCSSINRRRCSSASDSSANPFPSSYGPTYNLFAAHIADHPCSREQVQPYIRIVPKNVGCQSNDHQTNRVLPDFGQKILKDRPPIVLRHGWALLPYQPWPDDHPKVDQDRRRRIAS